MAVNGKLQTVAAIETEPLKMGVTHTQSRCSGEDKIAAVNQTLPVQHVPTHFTV
jgi:hypothetical protein